MNRFLYPLLFLIILMALWQGIVIYFQIPDYLLPTPQAVWIAFKLDPVLFISATWLTLKGALIGFFLSFILGLQMACLMSRFIPLRYMFSPYAVFFQTVPIVAIAPLIIVWFGTGFLSVVIIVFIVSVFPVITNGVAGFSKKRPLFEDLLSLYGVSGVRRFMFYSLPLAVPEITSGVQVSAGLSVIGAILGEFFAGFGTSHFGLGYLIINSAGQLKMADLFVTIFCATGLGMLFMLMIHLFFKVLLKKYQS